MGNSKNNPIGVFDSGVGGLTVLKALQHRLPHESFLYFGDTARVPYGTRTKAEIIQFGREILTWMLQQNAKMVVMACNTSSALALDEIRQEFPIPILGLILPGAKAAVQAGARIGIIATPATVQSNAYRRAILEINPHAQVWQVGCPEFVPLIEQDKIHHPQTPAIVSSYLNLLLEQGIDTLVYGCTHYPHLAPIIEMLLPSNVQCVDPALSVSQATQQEVQVLGLECLPHQRGVTQFFASGEPTQFAQTAQRWLRDRPHVQRVCLNFPHLTPGVLNRADS